MFVVTRRVTVRSVEEAAQKAAAGLVPILQRSSGFRGYHIIDAGDGVGMSIGVFESREAEGPPKLMQSGGERGYCLASLVRDVLQYPDGLLFLRCKRAKYKGIGRCPVVNRITFEEEFRLLCIRTP